MQYMKQIVDFAKNSLESIDPVDVTADYLDSRVKILDDYWLEFRDRHNLLLTHLNTLKEQDYFVKDEFSRISIAYSSGRAKLVKRFEEIIKIAQPEVAAQPVLANPTKRSFIKMSPPTFSGLHQDWDTFKELFCSVIKDDSSISDVEKMQHLVNGLHGGSAEAVLKGLKITAANLDVAWDKLVRRYDNSKIKLHTYFDLLINAPPMVEKSISELMRILDVAGEVRNGLLDLGCPVVYYDLWFIHLIVIKLDSNTRESWELSQQDKHEFSTYADLACFLESRSNALYTAYIDHPNGDSKKSESSKQRGKT